MAKDTAVTVPIWAVSAMVVAGLMNFLVLFTIVMWAQNPSRAPADLSPEATIGLHIQLLETMLGALGLGLAIVGFIGYQAIRNAAVKAAEDAAERYYSATRKPDSPAPSSQVTLPQFDDPPNPAGAVIPEDDKL